MASDRDACCSDPDIAEAMAHALRQPAHAAFYIMGRELARLLPNRAIIATRQGTFRPTAFAADGRCRLKERPGVYSEMLMDWFVSDRRFEWTPGNVWLSVQWQGHALELIRLCMPAHYGDRECWWIIGKSAKVVRRFHAEVCDWWSEIRGEVLVFDGGCWEKSAELHDAIQGVTLDSLILAGALKQQIRDDFERFFAAREHYERYGVPWKRGVLFVGPPGNGKTHAVKALVNWLGRPCLYVRSFKAPYRDDHGPIASVFARARSTTPCVLVLEDLDALLTDKNRAYFLNELDGFAANTGVLVLATTNHPERLDPAILDRPSRFDRKYPFDLPGVPERAAYLALWNDHLRPELRLTPDGAERVVSGTDGFSFAYLKELVLVSMMAWVNTPGDPPMDAVMLDQVEPLRRQMLSGAAAQASVPPAGDEEDDEDE